MGRSLPCTVTAQSLVSTWCLKNMCSVSLFGVQGGGGEGQRITRRSLALDLSHGDLRLPARGVEEADYAKELGNKRANGVGQV